MRREVQVPIVQVVLIAGRTDEQKTRLIAGLTDSVVTVLGVGAESVRVFIKDIPNTEFGIGGATAASLGRGIGR
ncbi:tautomerase family protein [Pandoraea apista]|uniref:Tautomerase n=2 Tax=Burkholderiaceae TaxID=119060 RepID=A0A5E4XUW7_9BURK|nr:2-hydroxymuconate tautomerase family protein [Pandoraea apista]CFB61377.1 2-hydroxymuconate tautomerase [Pandoraea apista]VVE39885.1 4-oxalocrotonate tautomerase [Pandoraea communis]